MTQMIDDHDPEYRIAYDMNHFKVGCILIQTALGGNVPRGLFFRHFDTDTWTVNASTCYIYLIRQSQLCAIAAHTISDRQDKNSPKSCAIAARTISDHQDKNSPKSCTIAAPTISDRQDKNSPKSCAIAARTISDRQDKNS